MTISPVCVHCDPIPKEQPPEGFWSRQVWWVKQAMSDEDAPDFHQWIALIFVSLLFLLLLVLSPALLPIAFVRKIIGKKSGQTPDS